MLAHREDGRPITSWPNQDEAPGNVALGLRALTKSLLNVQVAAPSEAQFLREQPEQPNAPDIRIKVTGHKTEFIKVTIRMVSQGQAIECEIPLDMTVEAVIIELGAHLALPKIEVDGHLVQWDLDSRMQARTLDPRKTLRASNVKEGDVLTFIRELRAG